MLQLPSFKLVTVNAVPDYKHSAFSDLKMNYRSVMCLKFKLYKLETRKMFTCEEAQF
jgi:hypothetical protein